MSRVELEWCAVKAGMDEQDAFRASIKELFEFLAYSNNPCQIA